MGIDVERALNSAARLGLLEDERLYSRAAVVDALSRAGLGGFDVEQAFEVVRTHAAHAQRLGAVQVEAVGERRGRRYRFFGLASGAPPAKRVEIDVHHGDNLPILRSLPTASFDLIYIDPPFNTGKQQTRTRIRTRRDERGDRTGFGGKRYQTVKVGTTGFSDAFDDFLAFMEPRFEEASRLLKPDGSFFLHIDHREVHYCKVLLDTHFGRECFVNEIVWAYDYGARSTRKWSAKHDNILWYVKDPKRYTFNHEEMDRIPYMAPGLVGEAKAARGKTPTDVWWHTIVPTNGRERTGYPTQKPLGILNRIVKVHSCPGQRVLDFFAGSGTTGEAAARLGRSCTLIDDNAAAIRVMAQRLSFAEPRFHGCDEKDLEVEEPRQPGLFD